MAAAKSYPLAALTLDPNNLKKHSARDINAIAASLEEFGQQTPIVIKTAGDLRIIIKGNGTYQAAKQLGWPSIVAIETKLDGDELTAYAVADNHTATLSEWDIERLESQVRALDDRLQSKLGFDKTELNQLLEHHSPQPGGSLSVVIPDARDSYSIRVDGVSSEDREQIVRNLATKLAAAGLKYTVEVK